MNPLKDPQPVCSHPCLPVGTWMHPEERGMACGTRGWPFPPIPEWVCQVAAWPFIRFKVHGPSSHRERAISSVGSGLWYSLVHGRK